MVTTSSSTSSAPITNDEALLFHGLLLVANPAGVVDGAGLATLETFCNTLPDFRGKDFDELLGQAVKVQGRYAGLKDSIKELAELKSQEQRIKLFVLAVDMAMSAGPLTKTTDDLLEALAQTLGIDEELAVQIVAVLNLKYRQPGA